LYQLQNLIFYIKLKIYGILGAKIAFDAVGDQLHEAADKTTAASQAMGADTAGILLRLYPVFSASNY
jgi:hypothetical protein